MDMPSGQTDFFRDIVLKLSEQTSLDFLAYTMLESLESLSIIENVELYETHHQNIRLKDNTEGMEKQNVYHYSRKDNLFIEVLDNELNSLSSILILPHAKFIVETNEWVFKFKLQKKTTQLLYIKWNNVSKRELGEVNDLAIFYKNLSRLIESTEHDTLTGLFNRKSLNDRLSKVISSYNNNSKIEPDNNATPWLAILDIDFFKIINDTYGHLYGDEILLLFSQIMQKCFRYEDQLFRFGGEEFLVLLDNTNHNGVVGALERFRCSIENYPFPNNKNITVSIGYVCIKPNHLPSSLLDEADHALYKAKNNGRNQIVQFTDDEINSSTPELFT